MSGCAARPVGPPGAMEKALMEQQRLGAEVDILARHVAALERLLELGLEVELWTR